MTKSQYAASLRDKDIKIMAESGLTFAEIGRRLSLSRERIRQLLVKQGTTAKDFTDERSITAYKFQCLNCNNIIVTKRIYSHYYADDAQFIKFCTPKCWKEFRKQHVGKDNAPRRTSKSAFGTKKYRSIHLGKGKYQYEHILVMQKHLGRLLYPTECVHHINGNGLDNSLENLQVMTRSEHAKLTFNESWKPLKLLLTKGSGEKIRIKRKLLK